MTRLLILGASGFLGRHVRWALEADPQAGAGHYVDRRPPADEAGADPDRWTSLDLVAASADDLAKLVDEVEPDVVVNCVGAVSGTMESLWSLNVGLVDKVLRVLAARSPVAFVHLGSAAEYGRVEPGSPIAESAACHPIGDYGRSKLAATELVCRTARAGTVSATVLKNFNPVGIGASEDSLAGRAARAIGSARSEQRRWLELGPLGSYRDFIDARDVVAAVLAVATAWRPPPILNVGSGQPVICRSLVLLLAAIVGYLGEIRETRPQPLRSSEVPWQQADISAINQVVGWKPTYALEDSLRRLWLSMAS